MLVAERTVSVFQLRMKQFGWDARIRTAIRRSRVLLKASRINRMKRLALQGAEKFGKIRKAAARSEGAKDR
jgi:hypothetical protein